MKSSLVLIERSAIDNLRSENEVNRGGNCVNTKLIFLSHVIKFLPPPTHSLSPPILQVLKKQIQNLTNVFKVGSSFRCIVHGASPILPGGHTPSLYFLFTKAPSIFVCQFSAQSDLERLCEYSTECSVLQEEVTKVESGLQLDLNLEKSRIKEEVRTMRVLWSSVLLPRISDC